MASPTDRARLHLWRLQLNANVVRGASVPQSALLPTGSRLRGIALGHDLVLGRDLRWYRLTDGQATRVTNTVVLDAFGSFTALRAAFYDSLKRK